MKKFLRTMLCMLLALSMLVCFAACDSEDKDKDKEKNEEKAASAAEDILEAVIKEETAKSFSFDKEKAIFNDFGGDDVDDIYKILKKSNVESEKTATKENMVKTYTKSYGDDYKFSYETDSTDEMDKDMMEQFGDDLNDYGKKLAKAVKNLDAEDLANAMDISESDAEKFLKAVKAFAETMEDAEVTDGVLLNYTYIIKGSKVDEDDEEVLHVIAAYKVDDCWISVHVINLVDDYISMLEDI